MRTGQTERGGLLVFSAALILTVVLPAVTHAQPGGLDQWFGTHGRVTTAAYDGVPWDKVNAHIAEAPGGGLIVAGDQRVARYGPEGRLDAAFGENGVATVGYPKGLIFSLRDLEVDSAGRVLLIGTGTDGSMRLFRPPSNPPGIFHPTVAIIIRYLPNGTLDPAFGGDGIVKTDFGIPPPPYHYNGPTVELAAGTVDASDRLLLVVGIRELRVGCGFRSHMERVDTSIMRLRPDGEPDPVFGGGDGFAPLPGVERVADLTLDWRGRVVLAAAVATPCEERPLTAFFRLTQDGAPDSGYGSDIAVEAPREIALDSMGRLVAMSHPERPEKRGSRVRLWRLRPSGKPDDSFGRNGGAVVAIRGLEGPYDGESLTSLAVDRQGRVLAAGTFAFWAKKKVPRYKRARTRFTAIRLTSSGRPDRRFGRGGWVITRFGRRSNAVGGAALVDARGRLVVAGSAMRPSLQPTGGFALARYRSR